MTRLNHKRSNLGLAPEGEISRIAREEGVSRQAVWQRLKRRADNAARGIGTFDRAEHRCSVCGEAGHFKPTCNKKRTRRKKKPVVS